MDVTERDRLVAQHWGLVESTVNRFLRRHPSSVYLRDDMLAAAALRLVELATEFGSSDLSFDLVVRYNLRWTCLDVIRLEEPVQNPRESRRRRRVPAGAEHLARPNDRLQEVEIADLINRHCRDYLDWAAVTLSREGFSIPQIAAKLRISYPTVKRRLQRIGELIQR